MCDGSPAGSQSPLLTWASFLFAWTDQPRVDVAFVPTGHTHLGFAILKSLSGPFAMYEFEIRSSLTAKPENPWAA